jgi:type II secretory pathway predicted ATPase ExeA
MYRDYFQLRERPFAHAPGQRFFMANPGVGDAVARLRQVLTARDAMAVITGGPGVGKSTIVEQALAAAGDGIIITRVDLRFAEPDELFPLLLLALGEETGETGTARAVHAVRRAMGRFGRHGQRIVLSLDCTGLTAELARQLLRLMNLAGEHDCQLNLILQGPHALHQQLDLPGLIQLRQRVSYRFRMRPLTLVETDRYIRQQIEAAGGDAASAITGSVSAAVYCYVAGVPRLINTLMDAAFSDACLARITQPDGSLVKRSAEQLGWKPLTPKQAETAPLPKTALVNGDSLSRSSHLRVLPSHPAAPAVPARPSPVPMAGLAARAASLATSDAVRATPRRADSLPRPPVTMQATDTGATGMLRLQDLDERFAEAVFGKEPRDLTVGGCEPGIDRS